MPGYLPYFLPDHDDQSLRNTEVRKLIPGDRLSRSKRRIAWEAKKKKEAAAMPPGEEFLAGKWR
jgi:hypothetical protein